MPAQPHSRDAYIYLFHRLYCDAAPLDAVAAEVGIHPTIAFKAATGYSKGKDGAIGRACFITWLKGLRSPDGAPCCRGRIHPGKRLLVRTPAQDGAHASLQALEAEAAVIQAKLDRLRRGLEGDNPAPLEDADLDWKAASGS